MTRFSKGSGLLLASAAALVVVGSTPVQATDFLLPGKVTVIKEAKVVKVIAKPTTTFPALFTIPTPLGAADPTLVGGTLAIIDTGDAGALMNDTLPSSRWQGLGNPPGTTGYKYKNADAPLIGGVCKVVIVKPKVIKAVCKDDETLNPGVVGQVGATLTLGPDRWCAEFGGTETANDAAKGTKRKNADPPPDCPTVPACCGLPSDPMTTASFHRFSSVAGVGSCGSITTVTGAFSSLACNGRYSGGGGNSFPLPWTLPDMTESITEITACTGQSATLGAATSAQTGSNRNCTAVGCLFGAPLPVPNPTSIPTSLCFVSHVTTAATGALNCETGAETLSLAVGNVFYLTGDTATDPSGTIAGIQPCPLCSSGSCIGGLNNGLGCTPGTTALTASYPTSQDCPPDPMLNIGTLPLSFALTTGTVTWTGTTSVNDTGTEINQLRVFAGFCRNRNDTLAFAFPAQKCWENGMAVGAACAEPFETCEQRNPGAFGPNGGANMTITEIGVPQAGLLSGAAAGTLVTIFAVPPFFESTVDGALDLPGPGAISLPGTGVLCSDAMACP